MPLLTFDDVNDLFANKGERISILLYADSLPRVSTYLPIARALRKAGYLCVLVLPQAAYHEPDMPDLEVSLITAASISRIRDLDLFISAEVVIDAAPKNTLRMAIFHSLPDTGVVRDYNGTFGSKSWLSGELDYLFIAARQSDAAWNVESYERFVANVFPAEMVKARRKDICIIPGGYPKIDALAQAAARAGPADRIFFCPTSSGQPNSVIKTYGADMIAAMLDLLPRYKLVFRPYPSSDRKRFQPLADTFADNPRFIYDTSPTGEEHAVRAVMAVTDGSSAAVTLSLATMRPSIFFRPDRTEDDRDFFPIGIFAHDMDEFRAAVSRFGSDPSCLAERIERGRNELVYNPGTAIDYLLEIIPDILNDTKRKDWLAIPRQPRVCTSDEARRKHLDLLWRRTAGGTRPGNLRTYEMVREFYDLKPAHDPK